VFLAGLVLLTVGLLASGAGLVLLANGVAGLIGAVGLGALPPDAWRSFHLAFAGVDLLVASVVTARLARQFLAPGVMPPQPAPEMSIEQGTQDRHMDGDGRDRGNGTSPGRHEW
jgi:hypothetical protein